jgi:hypothetical protein
MLELKANTFLNWRILMFLISKRSLIIVSVVIIFISAILSWDIIGNSLSNQKNKRDFAEINDIKYGLLSVDQWKKQIAVILSEEIDKLSLTDTNELELKKHVESQLNTLLTKIDGKIKEENAKSAKGWVKQTFINLFLSVEDIKKGIPEYADTIIHGITKAKTQTEIKDIIKKRLDVYLNETFDLQDTTSIKRILLSSHSLNIESAKINLKQQIDRKSSLIAKESLLLIILSLSLFIIIALNKNPIGPESLIALITILVILLITGVTTPMIDMEAKISEMTFVLLDHKVQFLNQVLYFQSKSILDVFWIMITNKAIEMKFVGILMVSFSLVFPVLKMICSVAYYFNYRQSKNKSLVKFFVLKSAKWSMADVLVVAIFMAYIGFNGIITSQFGEMNNSSQDLVILTTNGTALEPGFYIFTTYAVMALFFSGLIKKVDSLKG